nr:uncharacterized protein LOC117273796 isoform X2 [Nicotiana tomentosiformis]
MAEKVRQGLEQIGRLNSQVDELMAEGEKFKENMDILASRKEVVQSQLESTEAQLRATKENTLVLIEKVKELQSRLELAIYDKWPSSGSMLRLTRTRPRAWSNMLNGRLGEKLSRKSVLRASMLRPKLKMPRRRKTGLEG